MEVRLGGSAAEKSPDQKTSSSLSSSAAAEELVEAVAFSGEAQGKAPRKRSVEEGFLRRSRVVPFISMTGRVRSGWRWWFSSP